MSVPAVESTIAYVALDKPGDSHAAPQRSRMNAPSSAAPVAIVP